VHHELGKRIAALQRSEFAGEFDPSLNYGRKVYFIPTDTLVGVERANQLGIYDKTDLFGGVAPRPYMPTKAITHSLLDGRALCPAGWSHEFGRRVRHAVLHGATVFSLDDAKKAGARLLVAGPVRIKPVHATAGRGQTLVFTIAELHAALNELDTSRLAECGLVLEEHLNDVKTYSVGQVDIAGTVASYVGTQQLTADNHGAMIYGGSDLIVARGEFDALFALDLPDEMRLAITQAKIYDNAALSCLPGFFASRRNYDIARGIDSKGRIRSAVLEQSWRTGGASSAEINAIEVFHADPHTHVVRASTLELFGDKASAPAHAVELFHGIDADLGRLRKYVMVEPYGD
jgi:hypothetical protein